MFCFSMILSDSIIFIKKFTMALISSIWKIFGAQVTMYRQYRVGELPDVQIPHRALIAPLQALAQVGVHTKLSCTVAIDMICSVSELILHSAILSPLYLLTCTQLYSVGE